jgi:hypothetical protein
MFRRTVLRFVDAVRGRPGTSMVVMALLGAVVAATAIAASEQGGGPITAVKVVRDENSHATTSTDYVDLPGATTTITVPSGQRALILARFSAASFCDAVNVSANCESYVRILIGGVEGAPATGVGGFNDAPAGQGFRGSHAIERSRGGLGGLPAGNYQVKVQFRVLSSATVVYLGPWHLTVERSQIG